MLNYFFYFIHLVFIDGEKPLLIRDECHHHENVHSVVHAQKFRPVAIRAPSPGASLLWWWLRIIKGLVQATETVEDFEVKLVDHFECHRWVPNTETSADFP